LRPTNLRQADLRGAYLKGKNFKYADFTEARLEGAHLEGASLQGANFTGAHLEGAFLQGAKLAETKFHGAHLHGTLLQGVALRASEEEKAQGEDWESEGLSRDQLGDALGNQETRVPLNLENEKPGWWKVGTRPPLPETVLNGKVSFELKDFGNDFGPITFETGGEGWKVRFIDTGSLVLTHDHSYLSFHHIHKVYTVKKCLCPSDKRWHPCEKLEQPYQGIASWFRNHAYIRTERERPSNNAKQTGRRATGFRAKAYWEKFAEEVLHNRDKCREEAALLDHIPIGTIPIFHFRNGNQYFLASDNENVVFVLGDGGGREIVILIESPYSEYDVFVKKVRLLLGGATIGGFCLNDYEDLYEDLIDDL
jgi:hypothetical protein